jgi:hypothetical protein
MPIRITGFTLNHACNPGVAEARVAKKAAGAIFGQLDLLELRDESSCTSTFRMDTKFLLTTCVISENVP